MSLAGHMNVNLVLYNKCNQYILGIKPLSDLILRDAFINCYVENINIQYIIKYDNDSNKFVLKGAISKIKKEQIIEFNEELRKNVTPELTNKVKELNT